MTNKCNCSYEEGFVNGVHHASRIVLYSDNLSHIDCSYRRDICAVIRKEGCNEPVNTENETGR
jgi:hypothetical protein